jgi:hypothetical protein
MKSPLPILREGLELWRRDQATERARTWQGAEDAQTPSDVARRHKRLQTSEYAEALSELRALGIVDATSEGLLDAHFARAAAESSLAKERDALANAINDTVELEGAPIAIADLLDHMASQFRDNRYAKSNSKAALVLEATAQEASSRLHRARTRADESAQTWLNDAKPRADAGPARDELLKEAAAFFDGTQDLAGEMTERLCTTSRSRAPSEWHEVLPLVRSAELDSFVPRRERFRRVGALFAPLGLETYLSKFVRVVGAHGEVDVRAHLAAVDPPRDLRIAFSKLELGLLSEMAASEAVARALSHTLCDAALPVEARRPLDASVARSIGALFAYLLADPLFWRRVRGASRSDAERLSRSGAAIALMDARIAAGALVARHAPVRSLDEQRNVAGAQLSRVVPGVRIPDALASLVALTPAALGARFRARRAALALHVGLREQFDDDWFVNPRVAETLRAISSQGGATSIEAQCVELGIPLTTALARTNELANV